MQLVRRTILTMAFLAASSARAEDPTSSLLGHVTIATLPAFQQSALEHDAPIHDLHFTDDGSLFLLGKTALWRWTPDNRSLKRLDLHHQVAAGAEAPPFLRMGDDGLNLFAASATTLFQVQWESGKVYRYPLAASGEPLAFAGSGDNYWLVDSAALYQFDRYGRTLSARFKTPFLTGGDRALLDPTAKYLWFIRKTGLYGVDLQQANAEPRLLLKATHQLIDLQRYGNELVAHTRHTVLRLSLSGKLKRSIPVEGRHHLLAMAIGPEAHAYYFDDQLLEVFRVKAHVVQRFRLPLESGLEPERLAIAGDRFAMIAAGVAHVFRLDSSQ